MWLLLASAHAGTCEGTCAHVLTCMGVQDPAELQACALNCNMGAADPAMLDAIEKATCEQAIAIVNGGVAPPAAAPSAPSATTGPTAASPTPPSAATGGACPSPRAAGPDERVYALLTGSAWCSFSYSGHTTNTSRVVLGTNGVATSGAQAESAHGGDLTNMYGATTATWQAGSQSSDQQTGCWRLRGQTLELSADGRTWQPSPMQIAVNSSGYPIITANGTEYMTCR